MIDSDDYEVYSNKKTVRHKKRVQLYLSMSDVLFQMIITYKSWKSAKLLSGVKTFSRPMI